MQSEEDTAHQVRGGRSNVGGGSLMWWMSGGVAFKEKMLAMRCWVQSGLSMSRELATA